MQGGLSKPNSRENSQVFHFVHTPSTHISNFENSMEKEEDQSVNSIVDSLTDQFNTWSSVPLYSQDTEISIPPFSENDDSQLDNQLTPQMSPTPEPQSITKSDFDTTKLDPQRTLRLSPSPDPELFTKPPLSAVSEPDDRRELQFSPAIKLEDVTESEFSTPKVERSFPTIVVSQLA